MEYLSRLNELVNKTEVIRKCEKISIDDSEKEIIEICKSIGQNKIIAIGNGGSAAIASHVVTDFTRGCNCRAVSFSDYAVLTCLSNDIGYENVYAKQLELNCNSGDLLIAISSSGKSENILNAVYVARSKGAKIITLSGFDESNPLRNLGDYNYYVPIDHYGYVELIHQIILHSITDKYKDG